MLASLRLLRVSTAVIILVEACRLLLVLASSPVLSVDRSQLVVPDVAGTTSTTGGGGRDDLALPNIILDQKQQTHPPRIFFLEANRDRDKPATAAANPQNSSRSLSSTSLIRGGGRGLTVTSGTMRHVVEAMRRHPANETFSTDAESGAWQPPRTDWHPNCNLMHEAVDFFHDRITFHFGDNSGTQRLSISLHHGVAHLRMVRFTRNLHAKDFFRQIVDATAMDRLFSSKFVVSPYSICGLSILSEHMDRKTLRPRARKRDLPDLRRLQLGLQLAQAVADAHDQHIAHMDLQMKNVLMKEGIVHLNDFNLGQILDDNQHHPQPVKGIEGYEDRPPELLDGTVYPLNGDPRKFDVYALGNLLFEVWTRRHPYDDVDLSADAVAQRKRSGVDPPIPDTVGGVEPESPALRALQIAVRACFRPDPLQRPTARQVAHGLDAIYQRLLPDQEGSEMIVPNDLVDVAEYLGPFFSSTKANIAAY